LRARKELAEEYERVSLVEKRWGYWPQALVFHFTGWQSTSYFWRKRKNRARGRLGPPRGSKARYRQYSPWQTDDGSLPHHGVGKV